MYDYKQWLDNLYDVTAKILFLKEHLGFLPRKLPGGQDPVELLYDDLSKVATTLLVNALEDLDDLDDA